MFCSPASWLERVGVWTAAPPLQRRRTPPACCLQKQLLRKKKKPQKAMLGYHGVQKLPDVRWTFPSNT